MIQGDTKNLIKDIQTKIPSEVSQVTQKLTEAGFEAYLVGGCVRDLIMSREPKDWDVTTNANPEQIIGLFEKTVYENSFGTVMVCIPTQSVIRETSGHLPSPLQGEGGGEVGVVSQVTPKQPSEQVIALDNNVIHETNDINVPRKTQEYMIIEVTPYRTEAKYSDFRHPDEVKFSDNLSDDLKRRDFTVNAMAIGVKGHKQNLKDIVKIGDGDLVLIDMFGGLEDLQNKVLRTVGEADERFSEDALRMLRAIRFACQLNFSVSYFVSESILKNSLLIQKISMERIRDEFEKIILSSTPAVGVVMLNKFNLLKYIIPELEEGIGCEQLGEHVFDVWDHLLHALQHAADKGWPLEIRLSALFHDIGKPRTRRWDGTKAGGKGKYTFYGHEVVGARMAKKIMERLKFPKKDIDFVETMVRTHMFFSDTEKITLSAVRRIIAKVGKENIWLLMNIRECDRVGMKKKEAPYRLRKYFAMIEEALRDPISVGALKIDGEYMIKELGIKPGPRMGWMLHALLEEVLDDPSKNTVEHLSELVGSLNMLEDGALRTLGERGKEKKEDLEEKEVEKLHSKHGVRSGK